MILVMGHIKVAAGQGAELKDMLVAHMARVQQEDGCEEYSLAYDVADPDTIRIAERWAGPEALAARPGRSPEGVRPRASRLHRRIDQREGVGKASSGARSSATDSPHRSAQVRDETLASPSPPA